MSDRAGYQARAIHGSGFYDAGWGDRKSEAYRRGVKARKQWHRECAARRRGISAAATGNREYRRVPTLEIGGVTKTISEWCDVYQIDYQMVYERHHRQNMSWFDALTKPKWQRKKGADNE